MSRTISDQFRKETFNFVEIDDKIRKLAKTLKELKEKKKGYEAVLLDSMTKTKMPNITITDGSLRVNNSITTSSVNKGDMESIIRSNVSEQVFKKIYDEVEKHKKKTKRVYIKRTFNRT